jgi:hypothetical protein
MSPAIALAASNASNQLKAAGGLFTWAQSNTKSNPKDNHLMRIANI